MKNIQSKKLLGTNGLSLVFFASKSKGMDIPTIARGVDAFKILMDTANSDVSGSSKYRCPFNKSTGNQNDTKHDKLKSLVSYDASDYKTGKEAEAINKMI